MIRAGQVPTLTHGNMTRFGMALPLATQFISRVLSEMRGGDIFVPILPAFSLATLAKAAWRMWGLGGTEDPRWPVAGTRPGNERLYEILLSWEEADHRAHYAPPTPEALDGYYVVDPTARSWDREPWTPTPDLKEYRSSLPHRWLTTPELLASFTCLDLGLPSA